MLKKQQIHQPISAMTQISFLDYKGFEFQATTIIENLKCLVISLHYGGPQSPYPYIKQKRMENLQSSQILCDINFTFLMAWIYLFLDKELGR